MISEERKVGPKGQVVVPEVFRKSLGIMPGSILKIRSEGGRLIMEKVRGDSVGRFERIAKAGRSIRAVKPHEYEEELGKRAPI